MKQEWFEMRDVRGLQGASWIPLRQEEERTPAIEGTIETGEFVGIATLAVPKKNHDEADKLLWDDVKLGGHRPYQERGEYVPIDQFVDDLDSKKIGTSLVLDHFLESTRQSVWYLHPDLIVALDLLQEDDSWYRPDEGWIEVIRLKRDLRKEPVLIEMRAEFLSDYLAARGMEFFVSSYRSRDVVVPNAPVFSWSPDGLRLSRGRDRIHADIFEEDENPFAGTAVVHMARTNVDSEADAPTVNPHTDEGLVVRSGKIPHSGRHHVRVSGELWRTEWFQPDDRSPRVRGDKDVSGLLFAIDTAGARESAESLGRGHIRWLYFKPELIPALLRYRGSTLAWFSRDTGAVSAGSQPVHFGVNQIGLINILAKDIGRLPVWEQRVWNAHNVTPEGGVSRELMDAQMQAEPADTNAPEALLSEALAKLDETFADRTGRQLLRPHDAVPDLLRRIHRFRAVEHDGLPSLAKDVTRLFSERVNVDALQPLLPKTDKKLGSLKALERAFGLVMSDFDAHTLMSPLFGIYDLRLSDSHIGGEDKVESALKNAEIDPAAPVSAQGRQLLEAFVATLLKMIDATSKLPVGNPV